MKPTFGSLFAGVGGFDMGFEQAGYECMFQVEWDKHCQSVLNRHWPDIPKWGDVQDVKGDELSPVDVLIFGSPCQDLSVAGKRSGLEGGRSSMFFEAIRIIKEMQHATGGIYPRVAVWENVPGALTSNKGEDFAEVISQMANCGSHLTEWAVLDAQHFGVPQRRRRIFLVSIFDPAIARNCPDPLFPVAEGRRGDFAKGIQKGQEIAGTLGGGSGSRGWSPDTDRMTFVPAVNFDEYNFTGGEDTHHSIRAGTQQSTGVVTAFATNQRAEVREIGDISIALSAERGTNQQTYIAEPAIAFTAQRVGEAPRIYEDSAPALLSRMGTGGNNTPMVLGAIPIQGTIIGRSDTAGPQGPGYGDEDAPMFTLDTVSQHGVAQPIPIQDGREIEKHQNGLGVGSENDPSYTIDTTGAQSVAQPIIGFSAGNSSSSYGLAITDDGTPPLRAGASGTNQVPTIAFGWQENHHAGETHIEITTALTTTKTQAVLAPTLTASNDPSRSPQSVEVTQQVQAVYDAQYAVRRLTPLECERLMGWPDDHTRWNHEGKEQADSHRYKQCGNGVATPVARWVAKQIHTVL